MSPDISRMSTASFWMSTGIFGVSAATFLVSVNISRVIPVMLTLWWFGGALGTVRTQCNCLGVWPY